ncbi:hypothetical protein WOLCODRAFT_102920, partial [Wolfiporia cocos MD-104 SS10]
MIYEHVLNMDLEVRCVWQYRLSATSLLLFVNRYILLALGILYALEALGPLLPISLNCAALNITGATLELSLVAFGAAFSALRVFALTRRRWHITLVVLLTGLVPIGTNIYGYLSWSYMTRMIGNADICLGSGHISFEAHFKVMLATRICASVSDLVPIAITWLHTFSWSSHTAGVLKTGPFSTLLLRDGTVYFLILLFLNVLEIISSFSSGGGGTNFREYVTTFISPLTGILISRFIFNLRQLTGDGVNDTCATSHPTTSSARF